MGRVIYDADPVSRGPPATETLLRILVWNTLVSSCSAICWESSSISRLRFSRGLKRVSRMPMDPQAGIIILPHTVNGLFDLGDAQQAEYLRRHGNDQAVSGDIGVDGQNIKGGRSVDDDEIISVLEL